MCCMNEISLALAASEGPARLAHPHPGCSPALGGLQFCGNLVFTELPHGKGRQRLVCPGETGASVGAKGWLHPGLPFLSSRGGKRGVIPRKSRGSSEWW